MRSIALSAGAIAAGVLSVPLVTTGSPPASALAAGAAYVALGDSYSSAPGVPEYVAGTACSRSTHDYAHLTATELGLTLTDVTCAAAATRHLTEPQVDDTGQPVQGPQFDALAADTALVTLGMGANDDSYFWNMLLGWPQKDGMDDATAADHIRANVVDSVGRIRAIAPVARVVVVGYPALYPAEGWCDELLLQPDEIPRAYARNKALADAVRTAAVEAGVDFIEMFDRSAGHDICSTDPWVQGKTGAWGVATPFHPRLAEQQAVSDALVQLLGPAQPTTPPSPTTTDSVGPTDTPVPSPTETPVPTPTPTPSPTETPVPTPTPTASTTPTPTAGPTPTPTPSPTATRTATASASPSVTPAAASPAPSPTGSPTGTTSTPSAMPTVTWYPKQGRPVIRHWVWVPRPGCSPQVCSVDYRWRINDVTVGTGRSLYLRRAWRGKYVSVRVTVHAHGMAWVRTYRWWRPIHRA